MESMFDFISSEIEAFAISDIIFVILCLRIIYISIAKGFSIEIIKSTIMILFPIHLIV